MESEFGIPNEKEESKFGFSNEKGILNSENNFMVEFDLDSNNMELT